VDHHAGVARLIVHDTVDRKVTVDQFVSERLLVTL
jgi:hypothetical protein